jgi:CRISPR system Cascade subunit CasE
MAYLSRIWLNPLRRSTQRLIENPQALHAAVLGGLSRQPVAERVLWRLELEDVHRVGLLVLTQSMPSWEHLVEQASWPNSDEPQAQTRAYDALLANLVPGADFAFRLRANPTVSTRSPTTPSDPQRDRLAGLRRPRGVRVAHRTAAHQLRWLLDRAECWGFRIPATHGGDPMARVVARERVTFTKPGSDSGRNRVTLEVATFEGRLTVAEAVAARQSLLDGVGTARAYGCGLITLAPATHRSD